MTEQDATPTTQLNLDGYGADAAELRKFLALPKDDLARDLHKLILVKRQANAQAKEARLILDRFEKITGYNVDQTVAVYDKLSNGTVSYAELDDDEAEIALAFALTDQIDPAKVGIPDEDLDSYVQYIESEVFGSEDDGDGGGDDPQHGGDLATQLAEKERQIALRDKADEWNVPRDRRDAFFALYKDPIVDDKLDDNAKKTAIDTHKKEFQTKHAYLFNTQPTQTQVSTHGGGAVGVQRASDIAYQDAQTKGDVIGMLNANKGAPMNRTQNPEQE